MQPSGPERILRQMAPRDAVDWLRSSYESFNRTKQPDLERIAEDIVFVQPDALGGGEGTYHGREAYARGVRELTDTFEDFHVEPEKFFELDDQVLVFVRPRGRARQSGVPIDAPFAHLFTFRGELVSRFEAYADRNDALQAVGSAAPRA